MQFGKSCNPLSLVLKGMPVKVKSEHRWLGIWLDNMLKFKKHSEICCSKAKGAFSKFMSVVRGRRGVSIPISKNCYIALVRCHLEYAAPAWWFAGCKFIKEFQGVQESCLRSLASCFRNTSSKALEVVLGIQPFHLRVRDLILREYCRLIALPSTHPLSCLLEQASGNSSPIAYVIRSSRKISSHLHINNLVMKENKDLLPSHILQQRSIPVVTVVKGDIGKSGMRSEDNRRRARLEVEKFISDNLNESTAIIFCDGSELESHRCGASAVLVSSNQVDISSCPLPSCGDNVQAEVEGIVLSLDSALSFLSSGQKLSRFIIISDCESAVKIIQHQSDVRQWSDIFARLWRLLDSLSGCKVSCALGWIPSHCDIKFNDLADKEAKEAASKVSRSVQRSISLEQAKVVIKNIITSEWDKSWTTAESGNFTRAIVPSVKNHVKFSNSRSCAVSHIRALLNMAGVPDTMFKLSFSDSPNCLHCSRARGTVEHILFECLASQAYRMELEASLPSGIPVDIRILGPVPSSLAKSNRKAFVEAVHKFLSYFVF